MVECLFSQNFTALCKATDVTLTSSLNIDCFPYFPLLIFLRSLRIPLNVGLLSGLSSQHIFIRSIYGSGALSGGTWGLQ